MIFSLYAYRFEFQAVEAVRFAPGSAGNAFRGAFGHILRHIACRPECQSARSCRWRAQCAYARLFEPVWLDGPSGFADAPRPFVIRAAALDGRRCLPGAVFPVDVHVFDLAEPVLEYLVLAFLQLAAEGIGARRGRVALHRVYSLTASRQPGICVYEQGRGLAADAHTLIELPLLPATDAPAQGVTLRFTTPTELKSGGAVLRTAPFGAVFARARDRVCTIASLYSHPLLDLDLDFLALTKHAAAVETVSANLRWIAARRLSSRTGQAHPLGGFVGEVSYAGDVSEFLPILRAAYWTGIGRQTVWGKGVVETTPIP
ncbi:MAG TPA: CRISPR system precrRNA processing endoribonuclease RAMP protein Cas6 [Bryobacteraceae bacterium]|nr:CRISPR system precrRNA processing endoribonuclease RAMP protein Cas6 [Bryobacteraceae bacterium]